MLLPTLDVYIYEYAFHTCIWYVDEGVCQVCFMAHIWQALVLAHRASAGD